MSEYFEKKKDNGKLRMDLIDYNSVIELSKVLTFGAEKYSANSWQSVPDAENRYFAALMRHLIAYRSGEKQDTESGINHLSHAMCNIMFLMHFQGEND